MYSEKGGRIAWLLIFVGFQVTFFTQFIMGAKGMPRRYWSYLPEFQPYHVISTIGSYIMGSGFFVVAGVLLYSLYRGRRSGPNPWGAATLEWEAASPPPWDNFAETPVVGDPQTWRPSRPIPPRPAWVRTPPRSARPSTMAEAAHGTIPASPITDNAEQQFDSGKLGMWLFLATEVLLFGGLFVAYAVYRANHPEIFIYAHQFLDKTWGGINTLVLICSSLTMAWAVRAAQLGQQRLLVVLLSLTILGGFGFMGIKYVEYKAKWEHGLLPGTHFTHGAAAVHETAPRSYPRCAGSSRRPLRQDEPSVIARAPAGLQGLSARRGASTKRIRARQGLDLLRHLS
jgi:hypothetical protein